jgi:phosphoenolpyruvate carboxykinase (ATP)
MLIQKLKTYFFVLKFRRSNLLTPISKFNAAQAMYRLFRVILQKLQGTETGITESKPTFSTGFGAPFLPLHAGKYAQDA